jgi:heme A synthase
MNRTTRLAWVTIGWNLVTILLGALVRATHSGAGCGRSWPVCQGQLVPELRDLRGFGPTAIEFTHRLASGVALILVGLLVLVTHRRRQTPKAARKAACVAGAAIIGEALIGALIVLFEWVADDASLARAISVPLHLVNTLLLLGALTLTAWFLSRAGDGRNLLVRAPAARWLMVGAAGLAAIAATGAVTALADTLFPSESLASGLAADFSSAEHFLTRLRIVHPVLALLTVVAALGAARSRGLPRLATARALVTLTVIQVLAGIGNVLMGTPLWLRLFHLLVANLIWVSYVWLSAQVLSSSPDSLSGESTGARQAKPVHR